MVIWACDAPLRLETVKRFEPMRGEYHAGAGQLEMERAIDVKTEKRFLRTSISKLVPSKYEDEEAREDEEKKKDEEEEDEKESNGGKERKVMSQIFDVAIVLE